MWWAHRSGYRLRRWTLTTAAALAVVNGSECALDQPSESPYRRQYLSLYCCVNLSVTPRLFFLACFVYFSDIKVTLHHTTHKRRNDPNPTNNSQPSNRQSVEDIKTGSGCYHRRPTTSDTIASFQWLMCPRSRIPYSLRSAGVITAGSSVMLRKSLKKIDKITSAAFNLTPWKML